MIAKNSFTKKFKNEIEKHIIITFKTKRQALQFQQELRHKLFNSLNIYAFNNFTYSRFATNGAFHWSSKIAINSSLCSLEIIITKVGSK
jgi:hypothetical protein